MPEAEAPAEVCRKRIVRADGSCAYGSLQEKNCACRRQLLRKTDPKKTREKSDDGKEYADRVIKRVAEVLRSDFRSADDIICRLKDDEFVIIMTRMSSSMRSPVFDKIEQANQILSFVHESWTGEITDSHGPEKRELMKS